MNQLSPYKFDDSSDLDIQEEKPKIEKKKPSMSSYSFADSESYIPPTPRYEPEEEEDDEDDISGIDAFKLFAVDNSPKGLILKWLILFVLLLYVVWTSLQTLFTFSGDIEASLLPHKVMANMIGSNPSLALLTAGLVAFLSGVIIFMINKKGYLDDENYKLSGKKTHGSAKLADDEKMKGAVAFRDLDDPEGIVLGRKVLSETKQPVSVCVPRDIGRNMNFAVFGSSGSGKSYSFARPNLLTRIARGESFIVTDPSGELYRDTAALAEKNGFNVKILNLKNPSASNGWNPFDTIRNAGTLEVQMLTASLVHTILSNTADDNAKGDVFFDQSEENLLKALILYVAVSPYFKGQEWERHMGTVYDLLTKLAAQEGILEEFASKDKNGNVVLPDTDPAAPPWKMFQGAGKLKTNFITGLASRLELFQTDIIKEMFSHSEIDLGAPGREKCAYYVMSPVTNNKMRFILSLFFSCAFEELITDAERSGGKLKVPVYFVLDEFKAIGRINAFADKVANVRKYGISIAMIFQDLNQLKLSYDKDCNSILSNCDTWLAIGVNDIETAKMLSDRSGVATIETQSEAYSQMKVTPIQPVDPMLKINVSEQKRNLMNPDEIMTYFDNNGQGERKALVFARNKYPYQISTYDWHLHRLAGYVDRPEYRREATEYIPDWQKGEYYVIGREDRTFISTDNDDIDLVSESSPVIRQSGGYKDRSGGRSDTRPSSQSKQTKSNNAEDVAKKKPGGIVFNADTKSSHLVELGLDLTGKKKL